MIDIKIPKQWKKKGYDINMPEIIRRRNLVAITKSNKQFPNEFNKVRKMVNWNELGSKRSRKLNRDWIWYKIHYKRKRR